MKFLVVLSLSVLSFSAMADSVSKEYVGSANGSACSLSISTGSEYGDSIRLGNCNSSLPTNFKIKVIDNKISIPRDYAQVDEGKDCTIVVKVNSKAEPVSAVMKAGSFFSPILLPKLNCKNLVQVK
jgi:hypothetical protein